MRGKAPGVSRPALWKGITPAYAGKSLSKLRRRAGTRDHPRVCGEKRPVRRGACSGLGSPPRMRGKVSAGATLPRLGGITPAYAGKRISDSRTRRQTRDHPRVCGEKLTTFDAGKLIPGSPPRMRGKALFLSVLWVTSGITPAYAGKRLIHANGFCWPRDHPRVCGEKR